MARREYKGAAVPTRLSGSIGAADTSAGINASAGWPAGGAAGPFVTILDPGQPTEEHILVTSRTGTTLNSITRGWDDTVAVPHAVGADGSVIHGYSAVDANEANRHINDTTIDEHTQYMHQGGARHDLTARHSAGSVVPTAAPVAVGTVLNEGSGVNAARANHVHVIGTGAINLANMFAAGVVDAAAIGAGAVGSSELAADSVIAGKIANGAIDALADFATGIRPYYTQVADPGAVGSGIMWFDLTNRQIKFRNAANTGWELFGELIQPMVDYTPSFPMVTLSDGHKYGKIWRLGDLVVGIAGFTLGSAGNVNSIIKLDVPETLVQPSGERFSWMSGGRAVDASAGATYAGIAMVDHNTDSAAFSGYATAGASASWDQNTPFDWTASDHFHGFFMGEKV